MPRLSSHLRGEVDIWAKREDCNSGIAFGGNKVRKLEYLIPDALAQGCDTLVSIGGVQSNHTRQVTGVAAHLGLKAVTVQEAWVDWPDVVYDRVGNIQLSRIMGGDVRLNEAGFDIGVRSSWEAAVESVERSGGKPYPIPAGASDHPLGGLGFATGLSSSRSRSASSECFRHGDRVFGHRFDPRRHDRRSRSGGPRPKDPGDRRFGYGGTDPQAGHSHRESDGRGDRPRSRIDPDEIILLDGYHAGVYGKPDARTLEAIRTCAGLEGVLTDPVYEGKSMAALIDLVESGAIEPGRNVLLLTWGVSPLYPPMRACSVDMATCVSRLPYRPGPPTFPLRVP